MWIARRAEAARLAAYLGEATARRVLVVAGANGTGKTTLLRSAIDLHCQRSVEASSQPSVEANNQRSSEASSQRSDNGGFAQEPRRLVFEFEADDANVTFGARLRAFELNVLTQLAKLREGGGPVLSHADVFTLLKNRIDSAWPRIIARLKGLLQKKNKLNKIKSGGN